MSFNPVVEVKVSLDFGGDHQLAVGRLALRNSKIYFEYDASFVDLGINISPYQWPLEGGVQTFDPTVFDGLPGVFDDSIPDGWGRLLQDRKALAAGIPPENLSPLDHLTLVGSTGMGALVYEPDQTEQVHKDSINLYELSQDVEEVLQGTAIDTLGELCALNGSSGGARPKFAVDVAADKQTITYGAKVSQEGYEPWLVKIPARIEKGDAGAIEYVYAKMAVAAGLEMPETHLFPALDRSGYFAVKRFDRIGDRRLHMHSASGVLNVDFRASVSDYKSLLSLTMALTKDVEEMQKMFRLAAFNVLAHNRDDHLKNFSFLMNEQGDWRLSPAYDLTFSSGKGEQHTTTVMGEGQAPSIEHLVGLGREASIPKRTVDEIIQQTVAALSKWRSLAEEYGVGRDNISAIEKQIQLT